MRQYYDIYSLLEVAQVVKFLGTEEYYQHKEKRFPTEDFNIPVKENEAFLLNDKTLRKEFQERYERTQALYYKGQPPFDDLLQRIHQYIVIL